MAYVNRLSSEIHVDLRDESEKKKVPAQSLINKDNPLVVELSG